MLIWDIYSQLVSCVPFHLDLEINSIKKMVQLSIARDTGKLTISLTRKALWTEACMCKC